MIGRTRRVRDSNFPPEWGIMGPCGVDIKSGKGLWAGFEFLTVRFFLVVARIAKGGQPRGLFLTD